MVRPAAAGVAISTVASTSNGFVALLEPVTSAAFRTAARVRGARAFHPRGRSYTAQSRIDTDRAPAGFPTGTHRAIVRFSRGVGLPEAVPDILGVAVRLVDAAGPGVHQDLLMASAGDSLLGRHLLRPGRSFTSGVFSTILPYDLRGRRVVFGAWIAGDGEVLLDHVADHVVELLWSTPGAGSTERAVMGELRPGVPLGDEEERALGFDPFRTTPDVTPVGWLNDLRRPAYGASRHGRTGDPGARALPGRVGS